MHLGIDALGAIHGGAAIVLQEFVNAALCHSLVSKLTVFSSPASFRQFRLPTSPKLNVIERPREHSSHILRVWWLTQGLKRACRRAQIDRLLCLSNAGVPPAHLPAATFIQQSIPFSKEALARFPVRERFQLFVIKNLMAISAQATGRVFVQTHSMRDMVSEGLGVPQEQIAVFPPTAPMKIAVAKPVSGQGRIFMYVGSDAPHRNLTTLANAFELIKRGLPESVLWTTLPERHPIASVSGVETLGYVGRDEIERRMGEADMLLMPSLVETVCLPLLEAMARGLPVLVADRPYAREVCGDAGEFFNPRSHEALANAAIELALNSRRRQEMAEMGLKRAQELSQTSPYMEMLDHLLAIQPGTREG